MTTGSFQIEGDEGLAELHQRITNLESQLPGYGSHGPGRSSEAWAELHQRINNLAMGVTVRIAKELLDLAELYQQINELQRQRGYTPSRH